MRIDAITCCSGQLYAEQLAKSLPVWLDTLDSLTVVTKPDDAFLEVADEYLAQNRRNFRVITTNVFTQHGAFFNKGAALCEAYAAADPTDWVLHFDADIIPPCDWHSIRHELARGRLYGASRRREDGTSGDETDRFHPYGYFQLWHVTDRASWRWPIFDVHHAHCGSYDANFMDQWRRSHWVKLPFEVTHQGEPRTNWFGSGPGNEERMSALKAFGLRKYRLECNRTGADRLNIPIPKLQYVLGSVEPGWATEILRACMIGGPFGVQCHYQTQPRDHRTKHRMLNNHKNKPTSIQQEIIDACLPPLR